MAIALPSSQYGSFSPDFNPPVQLTGVLNAKTKDPEAAIKVIDYLSSPEWVKTTYSGIEGTHYKLDNGKEVPINADKNKKELDWLGDFRMLGGQYVYNEFDTTMKGFDQNNPLQKEFYDLGKDIFSLNISKDRPLASIMLGGFMPTLPADMQFISKTCLILPVTQLGIYGIKPLLAEPRILRRKRSRMRLRFGRNRMEISWKPGIKIGTRRIKTRW